MAIGEYRNAIALRLNRRDAKVLFGGLKKPSRTRNQFNGLLIGHPASKPYIGGCHLLQATKLWPCAHHHQLMVGQMTTKIVLSVLLVPLLVTALVKLGRNLDRAGQSA